MPGVRNHMQQIRKHYFLDEYCIIAERRKSRPTDFRKATAARADASSCPFCPGNEEMTPKSEAVYTDAGIFSDGISRVTGWNMRVFPNFFPALVPDPDISPVDMDWTALPGQGYHEVIVDSPGHTDNPADFSIHQIEQLLSVFRDRYQFYCSKSHVKYVSIFKNWGREAGASLSHSHSQLIALPILPPMIKRETEAISRDSACPFCDIVMKESHSSRLIDGNGGWISIAPFFSEAPYECWILPHRHISSLAEMNDAEKKSLALALKRALMSMRSVLNDPPYNCMIFQLPDHYHLNIRIKPAISKIAGFEKGTGVYINSFAPEMVAAQLRQKL